MMNSIRIVLYNLKGKTQSEKVQALRKWYGYRDKSYYRELSEVEFTKQKEIVLELKDSKDLGKVVKICGKFKISAEIGTIQ